MEEKKEKKTSKVKGAVFTSNNFHKHGKYIFCGNSCKYGNCCPGGNLC